MNDDIYLRGDQLTRTLFKVREAPDISKTTKNAFKINYILSIDPIYEDKILLSKIAEGDETAFRLFYDRHWNRIYTMALMYLKDVLEAQDAVQEVFGKLWSVRYSLEKVDNPAAYLYVLGRNYILSSLRKKTNVVVYGDALNSIDSESDMPADGLVSFKEVSILLNRAVEELSPQQKNVYRLAKEEAMPLKEVAERLGISYSTAREYMSLALKSIRKFLSEHLKELPVVVAIFFL